MFCLYLRAASTTENAYYSAVKKGVGDRMSAATEASVFLATLDRVEQIEGVANAMPDADKSRTVLWGVIRKELVAAAPVRPSAAAEILGLTEKTVRAWITEGVLATSTSKPRLLLEPERLHAVWHLIRDLRAAGKTRGLLDEVYRRLSDQALLERNDLAESLEQMRCGEGRLVASRPQSE